MARNSADILKEYLVSIGFQVDESQHKKMKSSLADVAKRFEALAFQAAEAASALAVAVTTITSKLEKLYFASQRTGASAANISAFRYAAEQVGVSAEDAQAALEGMTRAMRLNPGLLGMLKSLNINPNQDKVKVLMDLIDRLRRMPFYQGAAIARLFGIDDNTLVMLEKNFDELKRFEEERARMAAQAGMDADQMSKKSHEFQQHLRAFEQRLELLWDLIAVRFIPIGEKLLEWGNKAIDFLIRADKETGGWSTQIVGITAAVGGLTIALRALAGIGSVLTGGAAGGGVLGSLTSGLTALLTGPLGPGILGGLLAKWGIDIKASEYQTRSDADYASAAAGSKQAQAFVQQYMKETGRDPYKEAADGSTTAWLDYGMWLKRSGRTQTKGGGISGVSSGNWPAPGQQFSAGFLARHPAFDINAKNVHDLIRENSLKFGVDSGLAEAVAYAESRFNQKALSKKGAIGTFQLMPDTAKMLGVDPNTLEGNVQGGVRYLSQLLQKYNGNVPLALAAYNAGEGAVSKYGGVPPFKETQDYIAEIMRYKLVHDNTSSGVVVSQKTEINVNGTDNPKQVANDVLNGQDRVNGDMVRNFAGATR